jgi:hypothetical protein
MLKLFSLLALGLALAGCATSTSMSGLSSLGRETHVTPMRGQDAERLRLDDAECVTWTRATKGEAEPFSGAEVRYAACVVARGYQAELCCLPQSHRLSSPIERPLATVVADWQRCRADKLSNDPMSPATISAVEKASRARECLAQYGYVVDAQPDAIGDSIRKK